MSVIQFEDLNDFDPSGGGYVVPNEDPLAWRELVKGRRIERAAGICSGGEVCFFGLLPTVRRELVLVDHSYNSLGFAMLKYLLLLERGWKETKRLLTQRDTTELLAVFDHLKAELPKPCDVDGAKYERHYMSSTPQLDQYTAGDLKRMWDYLPDDLLRKAVSKLEKVRFVHGDLTDLLDREPFDMFYLSNAHGHMDRNGRSPLTEQITKLVKPGGLIVSTSLWGHRNTWTQVGCKKCSDHGFGWTYHLYQTAS